MVTVIERTHVEQETIIVDTFGDGGARLRIETEAENEWGTNGWYVTLTPEERNALAEALFTE